jgi:hypothetical protein
MLAVRFPSSILAAGMAGALAWLPPPARNAAAPADRLQQGSPPATSFIDAAITDDNGRPVTTLKPSDLRVTIDKASRQVVSVRYVFRGPGAETSASLADPVREAPAAAEHVRLVLVVVDETSIFPGQEKPVAAAAARILDELAATDQATVITVPLSGNRIAMSADAASRVATLARVVGRAVQEPETGSRAGEALTAIEKARDEAAAASRGDPDETAQSAERQQAAAQAARAARADNAEAEGKKQRQADALRGLLPVLDGLRPVVGLKTVVVVQQDMPAPGGQEPRQKEVAAFVEAAVRSRSVVHLVAVGSGGRRKNVGNDDLGQAVVGSGGTVSAVRQPNDSRSYDALRAALWGGYLVEVEAAEGDANGRPHSLRIDTTRKKTTVRTAQWWMPRADPVPRVVAASGAPALPAAAPDSSTPTAAPAGRARPRDPALAILIARLSEYLASYLREFANVVAEEDSFLEVKSGWRSGPRTRQMKSDLLLVKTADRAGWLQYRDVFEVDGKPVRDREARVQKLFLENTDDAPRKAQAISDESSRYNLGDLKRTINLPTLPLVLLSPALIDGVSFERAGEETIDGVKTARIDYEEMRRPTLVRQTGSALDAPASGTLWVEPSTGRIVKTSIEIQATHVTGTMSVTYKPGGTTGIWVPAEMQESYRRSGYEVSGKATYKNFRSFNVTTDVTIAK